MIGVDVVDLIGWNTKSSINHRVIRSYVCAEHTLVAFGGAAPLHAARLAEKLGIKRVVIPVNASVGSAVGFLRTPVAYEVVRSHYTRLHAFDYVGVNRVLMSLREEARAMVSLGAPGAPLVERRSAHMRYVGQGHEIVVSLPASELGSNAGEVLLDAFNCQYEKLFARVIPGADIEILSWVLTVSTVLESPPPIPPVQRQPAPESPQHCCIYDPAQGDWLTVSQYWRADLAPGEVVIGPALIAEDQTTTFVSASFVAHVNGHGYIVLEGKGVSPGADPQLDDGQEGQ